ncbi:hypothetical protein CVT24_010344 [Panaeolus cyanescens]|uniref:F-box domain-containing protein n=1 Tax=Panaeolus cyanescens TaxID=181874 RepID=A0A409YQF4_9AGAR|nr:hypothetical protein CVT24_010344 [Panaeolus cyanescens]
MNTLPPEIWMHIFSFACTDDGLTGRSLSLVSHYFYHLSLPYKYQSISIRRSDQLISLSRLIRSLRPAAKTTKYLYVRCPDTLLDVSDDEDDEDYLGSPMIVERSDDLVSNASSGDSDYEGELDAEEVMELQEDARALRLHDWEMMEESSEDEDEHGPQTSHSTGSYEKQMRYYDDRVLHALHTILSELSNTLLILSVHWSSFDSLLVEELLPPLPHLTELHLHRVFTSQDALEPESDKAAPLLFPQLQHLHLSGYLDQRTVPSSVCIQASCPRLSSLRVPKGIMSWVTLIYQSLDDV